MSPPHTPGDSPVTAHRPVSVRLSMADWLKVLGTVVTLVGGQSWVAKGYLDGMREAARTAQTTAEAAQKSADTAQITANAALSRVDNLKDSTSTNLVKIAADVGEIKGAMSQLTREQRHNP